MDEFTVKHMRKWIAAQFQHETDEEREAIESKMSAKFQEDIEHWANTDYWRLYQTAIS